MWFDPSVRLDPASADAAIRAHLEAYYDAVPRPASRVEAFGSLVLFVREGGGFPYYARPVLGYDGPATVEDVRAVLARQHELGLPQSLEWVAETTPTLEPAARSAGLTVHRHPLMVHENDSTSSATVGSDGQVPEVVARVLGADDPDLPSAIAAAHLAFAEPGTAIGIAGRRELAKEAADVSLNGWLHSLSERIRTGRTVVAAAFDDGVAVCSGQHIPVEGTTEVVGVGTLPSARRRGLGHAVTSALVTDARWRGISTVFLSAGDDDVARMYGRIGFRQVGTALIAEPHPG